MLRSFKVAAVVSIATAALIYGLMERGRSRRADRVLHALPSTARAIVRIDTDALERSGAAGALLEAFVPEEQLSEIETTCGLDPMSNLSEVTVWVRGPESQPFQSAGVMLRGRTADASVLADCHRLLVEARGASVVRIDAPTGPMLTSRDQRSAVAVLDGRTIVTGSTRTVAEAMAVHRGLLPALIERASIAELWPRVSRGAAIAAVLDPPEHWKTALERVTAFGDEASALEGVQAIALSVPSGSQRTIEVWIDVTDRETAKRDAEIIRSWASDPPQSVEPPWSELLRSARVQLAERRIAVSLDVSSLSTRR